MRGYYDPFLYCLSYPDLIALIRKIVKEGTTRICSYCDSTIDCCEAEECDECKKTFCRFGCELTMCPGCWKYLCRECEYTCYCR